MKVPPAAVDLIKSFEGIVDGDPSTVNLDPYLDPVGIWTIGWGHAITAGKRLLRGEADAALAKSLYPDGLTREQAERLLAEDIAAVERDVQQMFPIALSDGQFGALVSFCFNLGTQATGASALRRAMLEGRLAEAADQFDRWIYAGGVPMNGLRRRRAAEKSLFLTA